MIFDSKKAVTLTTLGINAVLFFLGTNLFIAAWIFFVKNFWFSMAMLLGACVAFIFNCCNYAIEEDTPDYIYVRNLFHKKKYYYDELSYVWIGYNFYSKDRGTIFLKFKGRFNIVVVTVTENIGNLRLIESHQKRLWRNKNEKF